MQNKFLRSRRKNRGPLRTAEGRKTYFSVRKNTVHTLAGWLGWGAGLAGVVGWLVGLVGWVGWLGFGFGFGFGLGWGGIAGQNELWDSTTEVLWQTISQPNRNMKTICFFLFFGF